MTFEKKCREAAERLGLGEPLFLADERQAAAYEDDGALHIVRRGLRAVFNVDNDDGRVQNKRTREVLEAMGMERLIGPSTLVDEEEEDGDCCPHCGGEL